MKTNRVLSPLLVPMYRGIVISLRFHLFQAHCGNRACLFRTTTLQSPNKEGANGTQWHPRHCPAPGKSLGAPLGVKLSRKAIKRLPKGRKMSHLDASFGPSTCRHRSRGNTTPFPRSPLAGASNETPGLAHKSR